MPARGALAQAHDRKRSASNDAQAIRYRGMHEIAQVVLLHAVRHGIAHFVHTFVAVVLGLGGMRWIARQHAIEVVLNAALCIEGAVIDVRLRPVVVDRVVDLTGA